MTLRAGAGFCLCVAAFAAGQASAGSRQGLRGTVVISPGFPVCQAGVSCSRPAANVVLRFVRGGSRVASARTDADGRYHVALPTGNFAVRILGVGPAPLLRLAPRTVRVRRDRIGHVDFTLDIGIR
jgi:Carboxypeptidase regulatory-like domain